MDTSYWRWFPVWPPEEKDCLRVRMLAVLNHRLWTVQSTINSFCSISSFWTPPFHFHFHWNCVTYHQCHHPKWTFDSPHSLQKLFFMVLEAILHFSCIIQTWFKCCIIIITSTKALRPLQTHNRNYKCVQLTEKFAQKLLSSIWWLFFYFFFLPNVSPIRTSA